MSDWPTPRMRTAADMAAMDAVALKGPLHGVVQAAVTAALDVAPTVDGMVWCEYVPPDEELTLAEVEFGVKLRPHTALTRNTCPGPHRTLIIGPEVTP